MTSGNWKGIVWEWKIPENYSDMVLMWLLPEYDSCIPISVSYNQKITAYRSYLISLPFLVMLEWVCVGVCLCRHVLCLVNRAKKLFFTPYSITDFNVCAVCMYSLHSTMEPLT